MNCLCCGKPINSESKKNNWHKKCIRKFFNETTLPLIDLDEKKMELIAEQCTNMGYTVPGVQKKLSLHLFSESGIPKLTIVDYPTGYILKPQVDEYISLPESEHLVMSMAELAGIRTVLHALIYCGEHLAYITKRADRVFADGSVKLLAMEDFCQLDLRLTQDKYKGSYERCAKIIDRYSSQKGLDMSEFFMRIVFSFIVGNSDMHLKNFSLIETYEKSNEYILSPAYDLLPVNLILPEDTEQTALMLNGKKRNIRKKDFICLAEKCNISQKTALKIIDKLVSFKDNYIEMCMQSMLPEKMKEQFAKLIEKRIRIFR